MTVPELKNYLLWRNTRIEDPDSLEEIRRLLDSLDEDEVIYTLSAEQLRKVSDAQEAYRKGKVHSHDEVLAEIKRWLNG